MRQRLEEDRALRSAARSIIVDQFLRVREAASGKRMGEHLAAKVGDDALDLADRAEGILRKRGGTAAAVAAAIAGAAAALWLARAPITKLVGDLLKSSEGNDTPIDPVQEPDERIPASKVITQQTED
jgi:hypothetical protein